MTTFLAMVAVGLVSYAFRAVPLVVLDRVRVGERTERVVRHAGAAAMTALLVGSIGRGTTGVRPEVLVATGVALLLAVRGASMLRIVLAGSAVYALVLAVAGLVP
jgi:branched-subunit amino acid transport protein